MSWHTFIQLVFYLFVLLLAVKPLGIHMARVYEGKPQPLSWLAPVEKLIYRITAVDPDRGMPWKQYAACMMLFNIIGLLAVYALQRFQQFLPLNPMRVPAVPPSLAFNTAVSFATNTNWQSYAGETTLSYLTQMLGLTVQNFVSAATGMAVLVALIRGIAQKQKDTVGNFWQDTVRTVLYILLPLSLIVAVILLSQGVVQTFAHDIKVTTLASTEQVIARGPVASQVAIKQLGTNGGGFFNVNSAHPFENPTPLSNFVELLSILLIPAALCYAFGAMVNDRRQGWALLSVMLIIFIPCLWLCAHFEQQPDPALARMGVDQRLSALQPGGNMEGKEARFGIAQSSLWATATTAASNGSVNAMHDSFTPLGGLIPMLLMQLGEIIFGGAGSGLYGLLAFVIIAVFIAGLMIGRTPEYLGKKIEAYEMKMACMVILIPPIIVLAGAALAVALPQARSSILNPGPHGFSEILYAFSSAGNNNGSAFAGLSANTLFYNFALGIAMFFARYWLAIPMLAVAGSLSAKKVIPQSSGTLPTHSTVWTSYRFVTNMALGAVTNL